MGQDVAELIAEARVCAESVGFGTQHDRRVSGLLSRLADALAALQSGTLFAGSCNAARCKFKLRPGIPSPTETVADPEPEVGNGHIPVREKLITAIIDTGLFVPGVDLTAGEIADSILDADVIPTDSRSTQRLLILRLADALERVTPRGDDWEYGCSWIEGQERVYGIRDDEWTAKNDLHRMNIGYPYPEENYLVRRHSATSWEPFTPTGKEN